MAGSQEAVLAPQKVSCDGPVRVLGQRRQVEPGGGKTRPVQLVWLGTRESVGRYCDCHRFIRLNRHVLKAQLRIGLHDDGVRAGTKLKRRVPYSALLD